MAIDITGADLARSLHRFLKWRISWWRLRATLSAKTLVRAASGDASQCHRERKLQWPLRPLWHVYVIWGQKLVTAEGLLKIWSFKKHRSPTEEAQPHATSTLSDRMSRQVTPGSWVPPTGHGFSWIFWVGWGQYRGPDQNQADMIDSEM